MIIKKLEQKYGKKLINEIMKKGYLEGCTLVINKNGIEDIPEEDIIRAIKEIKGEKIGALEWDQVKSQEAFADYFLRRYLSVHGKKYAK